MAVLGLTLLLPAGPAQMGPFQLGIVFGLQLFLPSEQVAAGGSIYVFYCYICQLAVTAIYGMYGHYRLQLRWKRVTSAWSSDQDSATTRG